MKKLVALIVAVAALLGAAPAQAHLAYKPKSDSMQHRMKSQTLNLAHAEYVRKYGAREHKRWAVKAVGWLSRERNETRAALAPKAVSVYAIATQQAFALGVTAHEWYNCGVPLISRENANPPETWDPQNYNDSVGSPHGAYGLGQALPKEKMSRWGRDYLTNPATQIRWLHAYVRRWGGWCGANSTQLNQGWY